MKIFMRVTVQDELEGEAYLSLRDENCCTVFGINFHSSDLFKEFFFKHGVFYYKSMQKSVTPEYAAIIEFFKMTRTNKFICFKVVPFCKVGYDEQTSNDQTRDKIMGNIQRQGTQQVQTPSQEAQAYKDFNPLIQEFTSITGTDYLRLLKKLIYINGEVGEVTEVSGQLNLRQFLCLRCVRHIKNPKILEDTKSTFYESNKQEISKK